MMIGTDSVCFEADLRKMTYRPKSVVVPERIKTGKNNNAPEIHARALFFECKMQHHKASARKIEIPDGTERNHVVFVEFMFSCRASCGLLFFSGIGFFICLAQRQRPPNP
jgi:hypothetical protein